MVFHDQTRECAFPRPVGTRGGCGAGWGPCACPGGMTSGLGSLRPIGRSHPHQDKHKAPSSTLLRPLSLQDAYRMQDAPSPIRSAPFIGSPRPVPCAHLWGNAITPPPPGDHKGPPFPTSSALAPTDHPASYLASRLRLMPSGYNALRPPVIE